MLKRDKIHEHHNNSLRSESVVMLQLQHLLNRYEVNGLVLNLLASKIRATLGRSLEGDLAIIFITLEWLLINH